MANRLRRLVVLAASVVITTAACASNTPPTSQGLETDPSKISGNITFSTWWAYADQPLIDGFKSKYPKVKVTLDFTAIDSYPNKLQALASSNNVPDVFAVQGPTLVALVKAGKLYDLKQALATPAYDIAGTWGNSFVPTLLSGANQDVKSQETQGQVYGVPFNAISVATVYNKDIFSKAGVQPPSTFADLLANCQKISAAGYIPMSLTGKTWISWWPRLAWAQTMGNDSLANFSTSNPNYVKGFQLVKQMADAKCWSKSQITTDIAGETALFLQGKTAQFVTVPENFLKALETGATFPLGTYVLPPMDGKTPNLILGGGNANVIAVSAQSKNVSAAVAFAKFLTSSQAQGSLAKSQDTIPGVKIDLGSSNPLMAAYLTAAGNGFIDSSSYLPNFSVSGGTTFDSEILPKLILGQMSPQDAAAATKGLFAQ
jgi:ABC-type glycerol-3-phosphate transport system substrate-binding protein